MNDEHVQHIYAVHKDKTAVAGYSSVVSTEDVQAQDYNLSVATYVERKAEEQTVDIVELNARIAEIVERSNRLRAEIDRIVEDLQG